MALYTSTEYDNVSAYAVGAHTRYDGLGELKLPFARHKVTISTSARIFEIEGPHDWHRLCVEYPADAPGSHDHDLLTPDYRAVAEDWDAVHVCQFGLLASEQVRVESARGRTALTGRYAEMTAWLRWVFEGLERLPDPFEMPPLPEKLR